MLPTALPVLLKAILGCVKRRTFLSPRQLIRDASRNFRFLLKYASRDEIELLGRGNGGIVEIRNNIAQYEETSPLFGFLRYRRRNVLIKYLPDDCSRLIQGALRNATHAEDIGQRPLTWRLLSL